MEEGGVDRILHGERGGVVLNKHPGTEPSIEPPVFEHTTKRGHHEKVASKNHCKLTEQRALTMSLFLS
ncbi:hypothetical protein JTE90_001207 [Oedothorax gibbosus]|uniref:Uncharacterized protein n=1 Tax=Oedothorax gibbosus TaxID=931172 RepID=A0AAV6UVG3_9ARAC|nr:hypothetical protein JTE90_001207 [Oedothorax gibbosus]